MPRGYLFVSVTFITVQLKLFTDKIPPTYSEKYPAEIVELFHIHHKDTARVKFALGRTFPEQPICENQTIRHYIAKFKNKGHHFIII